MKTQSLFLLFITILASNAAIAVSVQLDRTIQHADVLPIFQLRCTECHYSGSKEEYCAKQVQSHAINDVKECDAFPPNWLDKNIASQQFWKDRMKTELFEVHQMPKKGPRTDGSDASYIGIPNWTPNELKLIKGFINNKKFKEVGAIPYEQAFNTELSAMIGKNKTKSDVPGNWWPPTEVQTHKIKDMLKENIGPGLDCTIQKKVSALNAEIMEKEISSSESFLSPEDLKQKRQDDLTLALAHEKKNLEEIYVKLIDNTAQLGNYVTRYNNNQTEGYDSDRLKELLGPSGLLIHGSGRDIYNYAIRLAGTKTYSFNPATITFDARKTLMDWLYTVGNVEVSYMELYSTNFSSLDKKPEEYECTEENISIPHFRDHESAEFITGEE